LKTHIKNPTRCKSVTKFYFISRVVGRVVADSVQQIQSQKPFIYAKPEAASAVLGS